MLKASPNNSDDEDATPKVGNLFASFKAKTPTSADASTPGKISVASEIRQVLPLLLHSAAMSRPEVGEHFSPLNPT